MIKRPTWILLGVFVVVLAAAIIYPRLPFTKKSESTPTPAAVDFINTLSNPVIAMKITDANGVTVGVERNADGNWVLNQPASDQPDSTRIQTAVDQAGSLSVLSSLTTPPAPGDIGLDPVSYHIQLTLADGNQKNFSVGSATPTGSGYYVQADDGSIKILNKTAIDGILDIFKTPPILPTPTVTTTEPEVTSTPTP